jgi:hypothetical protein
MRFGLRPERSARVLCRPLQTTYPDLEGLAERVVIEMAAADEKNFDVLAGCVWQYRGRVFSLSWGNVCQHSGLNRLERRKHTGQSQP